MKNIKTASFEKLQKQIKISNKKKEWNPNPWAICHTTVDKKNDPEKYERCVKEIKKKQNKKAQRYKSDEDIASEFSNMKIEDISFSSPDSGWINAYFPEAEEHVGGGANEISDRWIMYDNGKIAFDNWYPDDIYNKLVDAIKSEKQEQEDNPLMETKPVRTVGKGVQRGRYMDSEDFAKRIREIATGEEEERKNRQLEHQFRKKQIEMDREKEDESSASKLFNQLFFEKNQ